MYWVIDPPGSPNLATVETLMVICTEIHRLGAYYPDLGVGELTSVIRDLAGQLAARYPPYRPLLAKQFIDNPTLLEQPMRSQFKKLIFEPWKTLQVSHPHYVTMPPVIILRWNDINRLQSTFELLELVTEHSQPGICPPLLWVIFGCPRVHFPGRPFLQLVLPVSHYIKLSLSDDEVAGDTGLILRHAFNQFRRKRKEMFDEDETWPSQIQISRLGKIVSGVLEFVDVLLRFIGCGGSTKAQLETFLSYMVDSPLPSNISRYCALDHFYSQALHDIPPEIFPDTRNILECLWHTHLIYPSARGLAHLLGLEQGTFLDAFTRLLLGSGSGTRTQCARTLLRTGFTFQKIS